MNTNSQQKPDMPIVIKLGLAVMASVIVFGALALIAWLGFEVVYADRIYPGVYVLDYDLSGLTEAEASQLLSEKLDYTYAGQVQFTYQYQDWSASPD